MKRYRVLRGARGLFVVGTFVAALALAGCSGDDGKNGPPGPSGQVGPSGATGPSGQPGPTGATGPSGATGQPGPTGATGESGQPGPTGATGPSGDPGTSTGTLTGTITNSLTLAGIEGAKVTLTPAVSGSPITTGADGSYSLAVPIGAYTLAISATNFTSKSAATSVVAGGTATVNAALVPTAKVVVKASLAGAAAPDATLTATAVATPLDGSTVQSIAWSSAGIPVEIGSASDFSTPVVLPNLEAYKEYLLETINESSKDPTIDPDDQITDGLLNRWMIQPIVPLNLEEGEAVILKATVTTTSGTYTGTAQVATGGLPWKLTNGLQNVAPGETILFQGKEQATYDWAITSAPSGSTAVLTDATTRNPYMTPDKTGTYVLTVTDTAAATAVNLTISVADWTGVIVGEDSDGNPVADSACTVCHAPNGIAPDKFTPWAVSGHAHIFTDNIDNPAGHYSSACLPCHTVGFDLDVANNGFDDVKDYQQFLAKYTTDGSNFIHDVNNWTNILADLASNTLLQGRYANIQCENCHGPQGAGSAHPCDVGSSFPCGTNVTQRVSYSSAICGVCHGEPLRHARYQQWLRSAHGRYELAEEEGTSNNCGRCHSAQGFVQWSEQDFDPTYLLTVSWTADTVDPQTCAACHPPHDPGSTTGKPNNAIVRKEGNTSLLLSGYQALGVGRGAVCMECHNSRRGLKSEEAQPPCLPDSTGMCTNPNWKPATGSEPHPPTQTDLVMGQNLYFVSVGVRGPHSLIVDTCTNCHMEKTLPPADLSYQQGGTNHTFVPSLDICKNCHLSVEGANVDAIVREQLSYLHDAELAAVNNLITAVLGAGNTITVAGTPATTILPTDTVVVTEILGYHGQQGFSWTLNGTAQADTTLDSFTVPVNSTAKSLFRATWQGDVIERAGWNYYSINGDGSFGIHNPAFVFDGIDGAVQALSNLTYTTIYLQ